MDRKKITLLTLFLVCSAVLHAQDADRKEATLFLNTNPLEAWVSIDQIPLAEKTPLFLKNISPGKHEVEIRKLGFKKKSFELDLLPGSIETVYLVLEEKYPTFEFSSKKEVVLDGTVEIYAEESFRIPDGAYLFHSKENQLYIDPVFPQQGMINTLNLFIPIFLTFSGLLTVNDFMYPKKSGLFFSPATLSTYTATLGIIGVDIALHARKREYMASLSKTPIIKSESTDKAAQYYEKGQKILAQDELFEALGYYVLIIENYRDSVYFPRALYQIAKIHLITGEDVLAASEFKLIIEKYPLPDLYDRSLKNLADIYLRRGLYEEAIRYLEAIVFLDPLCPREEIDLYRRQIFEKWIREDEKTLEPAEQSVAIPESMEEDAGQ